MQTLFLVQGDGKQDGLHRIVGALVGSGLGVGADAQEQAVEVLLVLAPQGATEFCPSLRRLLDQLTKGGDGAAHRIPR